MYRVLVYAPTASTRKLYQKTLGKREREIVLCKDPAEFFLSLVTFEFDTLVLVDEGKLHEVEMLTEVIRRRYNQKRAILVSVQITSCKGFELFSSTRSFFGALNKEGDDIDTSQE